MSRTTSNRSEEMFKGILVKTVNLLSDCTKIFNYRLSRARRIVENAFGILTAIWRIFKRLLEVKIKTAKTIIKVCIALHNYLKMTDASTPPQARYISNTFVDAETMGEIIPGGWRSEVGSNDALIDIQRLSSNNSTQEAIEVRNNFKHYFTSYQGQVPWQNAVISRGMK